MLGELNQYSTATLQGMLSRISAEIERRDNGEIPTELACDVCGREPEGDRHEFDENAFACDSCYESSEKVRKDVHDWQEWQLEWKAKRTDELCKELHTERRLAEYYRNRNDAKNGKHTDRIAKIERELEEIGI